MLYAIATIPLLRARIRRAVTRAVASLALAQGFSVVLNRPTPAFSHTMRRPWDFTPFLKRQAEFRPDTLPVKNRASR
jgi:hypothetical protein